VALIFGGTVTVIPNVHESVRCWLSVAVQVTVDGPIGKMVPLAGVHTMVTGGAPLATVGVPYTTESGVACGDSTFIGAGHVILGGSETGGGGVGVVGGSLQAWSARAPASAISTRR